MSNVHPMNNRPGPVKGPIFDTLVNLLSGLGTAKDKTTQTRFTMQLLNREQLFFAYRGDWIARKIVDCPAQDSTREWRAWQAEKKQITDIEKAEKDLRIQMKVKQAMQRARLLGGAALIMGVDQGTPDQELRIDRVKAGQLKYVHVVNRDEIAVDQLDYDVTSEFYGEPTFYTVNSANSGMVRVHPSRVIRFLGNEVPDLQLTNNGWGDSVLQSIYDAVIQAGQTSANVASLVNEAKVDVVQIPDMMNNMATSEYRARLIERFTLANSMKSLTNTLILDKEEEWNRITASFAGLHDLIHVYLMMASGAADIPATRLLGQSAKGLNATGHEDTRNYYDRLSSDQKNDLSPRLDRLDEVLIRSVLGDKPEEVTYEWNSLWQLSETEAADVAAKKATVYTADVTAGLLPPEVLREGRENQLIEDGTYPGLEQAIDTYGKQNLDEYNQAVVAQMGARAALTAPDNPNDPNAANKKAAAAKAELARRKALPPPRPPAARSQDARPRATWYEIVDATTPRSLYVRRDVLNGEEILKHFEDQGVDTSDYDAADLHVTILYSRQPVDWIKMGESYHVQPGGADDLPDGVDMRINAGGPRVMEAYGVPPDTLVMCFASSALCYRHQHMIYQGASEDYEDFNPHLSVARWDGTDPRTLDPWIGEILLGPEIFEPVKQGGTEGETLDWNPDELRDMRGRWSKSPGTDAKHNAEVIRSSGVRLIAPDANRKDAEEALAHLLVESPHVLNKAGIKEVEFKKLGRLNGVHKGSKIFANVDSLVEHGPGFGASIIRHEAEHGSLTSQGVSTGKQEDRVRYSAGMWAALQYSKTKELNPRAARGFRTAAVEQGIKMRDALDAYDPSEPRAPAGSGQGGQWTSEGSWAGRLRESMRDNAGFDAVVAELKSSKVTQPQMHKIATEFFTAEWGHDPGFARSKSKGDLLGAMVDWQAVDARQRARLESHARQAGDYDPSEPRAAAGSSIGGEWTLSGTRAARLDKVLAEKRARAEGDLGARLKRTREAAVAKSKRMAATAAQKTVEFLKDNENKAEGLGMLASAFSGQLTGADIAVREMVHELVAGFAKQMDGHTAAARGALREALNKAIALRKGLTGDADQQSTDDVLAALQALLAELDKQEGEVVDWRRDVADYSPDQPREPAGSGRGGQFSTIIGGGFSSHARAAGLDVRIFKSKRLASGRASEVDESTRSGSGLLKPMSVEVAQEFKVGGKWRKNPDQAGDFAAGIGLMLARKFPSLARFAEQFWYDAAANMTPKEYAYAKSYFATRDGAFSEGYRAAFSPNGKAFGLNKARTEEVFGRSVGQLRVGVDSAIKGSGGSSGARAGLFSRMGSRLSRMIGA